MAREVAARVASGEYASESEVIHEGLHAPGARQKTIDHWLRGEVSNIVDRMKSDPAQGRSAVDVKASIAQADKPPAHRKWSGPGMSSSRRKPGPGLPGSMNIWPIMHRVERQGLRRCHR
jgi:antitoxin ParD1/3/4